MDLWHFRAEDTLDRAHHICLLNAQVRKQKPGEVAGLTSHHGAMTKGHDLLPLELASAWLVFYSQPSYLTLGVYILGETREVRNTGFGSIVPGFEI